YLKQNYSIKTGGSKTDERLLFIPVAYDIYNRINISRAFSDDSFGSGALSMLIEAVTGVWFSSAGGAYLRVLKANEYSYTAAF
ncbi:hypothetical protein ACI3PL_27640, partial [Lacticaseibacillus paracasei]